MEGRTSNLQRRCTKELRGDQSFTETVHQGMEGRTSIYKDGVPRSRGGNQSFTEMVHRLKGEPVIYSKVWWCTKDWRGNRSFTPRINGAPRIDGGNRSFRETVHHLIKAEGHSAPGVSCKNDQCDYYKLLWHLNQDSIIIIIAVMFLPSFWMMPQTFL